MELVKITTEDLLKEALAIRNEVFVVEQGVPEELEYDEFDVSPHACHHFVLQENGKTIAAGRWREYEPGIVKYQRIVVAKSSRGRGIGKLLLLGMEQDAKKLGYHSGVLDAQCSAEAFYQKLGYGTESTEPFLDANILHVRMSKKL
ncbi:acetyltransferase [Paenibacillus baekrokdamisoli]|uniref:Acetyltransferase n=1 Tax=Paenibacillus baekrokdamisoli TaxID=1712516 RepID=A0A3G9J9M3_9BACL|nr:GNAT family N-acetyltransferase [Paenibacillus baekrokdamisoli]MBB3070643.1 putative GNAT family N-acyltransferase [Paenibacillus baekrokdamisoli]BBH19994.1 acetyltransferase [Paenibacillus baekrokdamisoli]